MLLETLIALSLAAVLLTALLHFFAASLQLSRKVDLARNRLYEYEHLSMRLQTLLTNISSQSDLSDLADAFFYTVQEESSLVAIFNNGIDPDPLFSGPIRAKLFLKNHDLILDLSPLEKMAKPMHRQETLLSEVNSLKLQFLAKKDSLYLDPQATPIGNSFEWRTNWPKKRWDLPSHIRLFLETVQGTQSFAFSLPFSEPTIIYSIPGSSG